MTESSEPTISDAEYEQNITLSYDYIEKSIKEIQDIINNTNTQLGVLIGFNLTFTRFFISDLPARIINSDRRLCNSCLILKILAYGFSFISIIFCLLGLYRTVEFEIINSEVLIKQCDRFFNWELKLAILDLWQDKLNDFKKLAGTKKELFNYALVCLVVAVLFAISDRFIASIFY